MEAFAIAIFLSTVNLSIVDYLTAPLKQKYPNVDFWWLLYVALVTGAILGWYSGVNLFSDYLPSAEIGRILTAILIGGGSSLIHNIFDSGPDEGTRTTIESADKSTTTVQVQDE